MTFLEVDPPVRATSTDQMESKIHAKPASNPKTLVFSDLRPPAAPFFPNPV
jgi:hypothetical protein